jgi:hypothetical protein
MGDAGKPDSKKRRADIYRPERRHKSGFVCAKTTDGNARRGAITYGRSAYTQLPLSTIYDVSCCSPVYFGPLCPQTPTPLYRDIAMREIPASFIVPRKNGFCQGFISRGTEKLFLRQKRIGCSNHSRKISFFAE